MHRILGLDWADGALRAAVLETSFRGFAVKEVRVAPLPAEGTLADRLRAGLLGLALDPPLGGEDVVAVAMTGAQVASHVIVLPFTDPRRIDQVLPAEVEGAIPFDPGEVVWDHAVLSQQNGKTEVLVGVVRKTILRELIDALAGAGIEPRVITFAPLALAALGERGMLSGEEQPVVAGPTVALLEAGAEHADLTLLASGKPVLARGLAMAGATAWADAERDEAARTRLLNTIARDLKISLRSRPVKPERLLLAGRLARLPGAAERLSAELQIPVEPAPTPDTALAMGLALRAQQPRGRINFRRGEFALIRDLSLVRGQVRRLLLGAAALVVLALALGVARVSSLSKEASAYDEAVCTATKRILGTCLTDYRQALGQLSGGRSKAAGIPRVSAAEIFAELMASFPEGAMPQLEDVEVTTTSIRVKGVAESFGAVDTIVAALKKDKCFGEIKQPRVERQREGSKVSFTLDFAYACSGERQGGA